MVIACLMAKCIKYEVQKARIQIFEGGQVIRYVYVCTYEALHPTSHIMGVIVTPPTVSPIAWPGAIVTPPAAGALSSAEATLEQEREARWRPL